jgi:hypothetical protein
MKSAPFRFDEATHTYVDLGGVVLPHITGLLQLAGWVDETFFTAESCERGQAVHALTADYDLGALDPATCVSRYRGWLLGHVKAMSIVRPTFAHVEVPAVHPTLMFGGRPDRVATDFYGSAAVVEIKSGPPTKGHLIQTALQAILVAPELNLPAEHVLRFAEYATRNGRAKVERHERRADFDEAYRILKRYR